MANKHFALLIDDDFPNGFVIFSDYYENLKEQIDEKYEEFIFDVSKLKWDSYLLNNPYKTFKLKQKYNEQDNIGTRPEEQDPIRSGETE